MKTFKGGLTKVYINCGMTKVAIMPIYCKNLLTIFFSSSIMQLLLGLGRCI